MSHGTGSYYLVVSPEEQRRRALTEQQRRCDAIGEQLASARTEAEVLGVDLPDEVSAPTGDDLEGWVAHANDLAAQLVAVRRAASDARSRAWAVEMSKHLATVSEGIILDIHPAAPRATGVEEQRGMAPRFETVRRSLERALTQVALIEDASVRDRLATVAEGALRLLATDPNAAEGRLTILRNDVHESLTEQATTAKVRRLAEDLVFEAAALPDPALAAVVSMAGSASTEADIAEIRRKIDEEREHATAETDRRFVIDQTAAALQRMGYEVGEQFVASAIAGRALVEPPTLPGYGIELDFQQARGRLLTETIAMTHDTTDDLDAQVAGCAEVDQLSAELAASGVRLDRFHTAEPGKVPMERAIPPANDAAAGRRRRSSQRERQL